MGHWCNGSTPPSSSGGGMGSNPIWPLRAGISNRRRAPRRSYSDEGVNTLPSFGPHRRLRMGSYVARILIDVKLAADNDEDAKSLLRSTGEWEDWEIFEVQRLSEITNVNTWPYTPRNVEVKES